MHGKFLPRIVHEISEVRNPRTTTSMAQQCPRTVFVQTWYGENFQSCSMYETTVDCGIPALTSLCPSSSSNGNSVVTASSSAPTIPPKAPSPKGSHGLGTNAIMGIVFGTIGGVALLIFMLLPFSVWRKKWSRKGIVRRPEGTEMGRRHIPKPSVSTD